MNIYKL